MKLSIREKYKVHRSTPVGYAATLGDVLTINMRGYEREGISTSTSSSTSSGSDSDSSTSSSSGSDSGGGKLKPLPTVAGGDQLEVK